MSALLALALVTYGGGVYVTAKRSQRVYSGSGRWAVAGLWPVMLALSPRFRRSLKQR